MNYIFNLGEQMAELGHLGELSHIPHLLGLTQDIWAKFIVEDAREMLREKHFGGINNRTARLMEILAEHHRLVTFEDDRAAEFNRLRQYAVQIASMDSIEEVLESGAKDGKSEAQALGVPEDVLEMLNTIDDELDDLYYEIGTEVQDFINEFYSRGELWSVDHAPAANCLVFSFCCCKATVETAVRASGGNMEDFIRHITG